MQLTLRLARETLERRQTSDLERTASTRWPVRMSRATSLPHSQEVGRDSQDLDRGEGITSRSRDLAGALAVGAERQLDRQVGGCRSAVSAGASEKIVAKLGIWSLRRSRDPSGCRSECRGGRRGPSFCPNTVASPQLTQTHPGSLDPRGDAL
jgi:hypothetical protein